MATKTNFLDRFDLENDFDRIVDDPWHHFGKHNVSEEDIINLAGGIPCEEFSNCKVIIDTNQHDTFSVYIQSSEFEMQRTIDFHTMTIENSGMKVVNKGNGLGTNLLVNQVTTARKFGFNNIGITAVGGTDLGGNLDWNGHYTWGRLGFIMTEGEHKRFQGWLHDKPFKEKYLHEILEEELGQRVWKTIGYTWKGYFDLSDDSLSMEILKKYLLNRGINKIL